MLTIYKFTFTYTNMILYTKTEKEALHNKMDSMHRQQEYRLERYIEDLQKLSREVYKLKENLGVLLNYLQVEVVYNPPTVTIVKK